jgi:amidase
MSDQLWEKSAVELAAGIRDKQFSAVEVTESVLSRIEEKNGHLNAIVYTYADEALEAAKKADENISLKKPSGALHGVPVTWADP